MSLSKEEKIQLVILRTHEGCSYRQVADDTPINGDVVLLHRLVAILPSAWDFRQTSVSHGREISYSYKYLLCPEFIDTL